MRKKATLFYFTGTGNTLHLVKVLAARFRARGMTTEAVDLAEHDRKDRSFVPEADTLYGFVYPVYAYGPPKIMYRFLKGLPHGKGAEAFVAANAGEEVGMAVAIGKRLLKRRGYEIAGAESCFMPQNFSPLFAVPSDEECEAMIAEADETMAKFAEALADGTAEVRNGPGILGRALGLVYWLFRVIGTRNFNRLAVVEDTCNGCGVCAKLCPKGNIAMKDGLPVIGRNCEMCVRCLNYCPKSAIQAFSSRRHGRYRRMPLF